MIQTLDLANLVDRPHSQIPLRILSLSLHKFVEKGVCGRQRTPMMSLHWSWYWCLVLRKIISFQKQLHNGM